MDYARHSPTSRASRAPASMKCPCTANRRGAASTTARGSRGSRSFSSSACGGHLAATAAQAAKLCSLRPGLCLSEQQWWARPPAQTSEHRWPAPAGGRAPLALLGGRGGRRDLPGRESGSRRAFALPAVVRQVPGGAADVPEQCLGSKPPRLARHRLALRLFFDAADFLFFVFDFCLVFLHF